MSDSPFEVAAPHLAPKHLQIARVWRFLAPGESDDPDADESQLRAQQHPPSLGEHASYLVGAVFTLKSGIRLPGLVQVGVLGQQVECTPDSVFAGDKVVSALGNDTAARIERILNVANAQPVAWELDVVITGEASPRSDRIARPGAWQALGLLAQLVRLRRTR